MSAREYAKQGEKTAERCSGPFVKILVSKAINFVSCRSKKESLNKLYTIHRFEVVAEVVSETEYVALRID